jgi:methyl-accepting chemotaxis protein
MKNLRIGTRLALGFGAIAVLLVAACATALIVTRDIGHIISDLSSRALPNMVMAYKWEVTLQENARDMRTLLMLDDPERRKLVLKRISEAGTKRAEFYSALEKRITSPEGKVLLGKVAEVRSRLLPLETQFLQLAEQKETAKAQAFLLDTVRPVQLESMKVLDDLAQYEEKLATTEAKAADEEIHLGNQVLIGTTLAALALTVLIAFLITRSITAPVRNAAAFAERVAHGDLRESLASDRRDEVGQLIASLALMQQNLSALVREIQGHAEEVARASGDLVTTAEQVAVSTDQQSEAASAMAASVEEMTVSIGQISDNAESASERTAESGKLAASGSEVVVKAGGEMQHIARSIGESADMVKSLQEQSRAISSIADTIKAIAEQTNLLALNAAIEAARAGEQGRGFAVVADAVRSLAERTGQSTAEIGATIARVQSQTDTVFANMEAAVSRVRDGQALSDEAAGAIGHVNDAARQVMGSVGEISNALREQRQAANAIASHVEKIAQMAEENSGAVAHTRESAMGLKALAARLQASTQRFAV